MRSGLGEDGRGGGFAGRSTLLRMKRLHARTRRRRNKFPPNESMFSAAEGSKRQARPAVRSNEAGLLLTWAAGSPLPGRSSSLASDDNASDSDDDLPLAQVLLGRRATATPGSAPPRAGAAMHSAPACAPSSSPSAGAGAGSQQSSPHQQQEPGVHPLSQQQREQQTDSDGVSPPSQDSAPAASPAAAPAPTLLPQPDVSVTAGGLPACAANAPLAAGEEMALAMAATAPSPEQQPSAARLAPWPPSPSAAPAPLAVPAPPLPSAAAGSVARVDPTLPPAVAPSNVHVAPSGTHALPGTTAGASVACQGDALMLPAVAAAAFDYGGEDEVLPDRCVPICSWKQCRRCLPGWCGLRSCRPPTSSQVTPLASTTSHRVHRSEEDEPYG